METRFSWKFEEFCKFFQFLTLKTLLLTQKLAIIDRMKRPTNDCTRSSHDIPVVTVYKNTFFESFFIIFYQETRKKNALPVALHFPERFGAHWVYSGCPGHCFDEHFRTLLKNREILVIELKIELKISIIGIFSSKSKNASTRLVGAFPVFLTRFSWIFL